MSTAVYIRQGSVRRTVSQHACSVKQFRQSREQSVRKQPFNTSGRGGGLRKSWFITKKKSQPPSHVWTKSNLLECHTTTSITSPCLDKLIFIFTNSIVFFLQESSLFITIIKMFVSKAWTTPFLQSLTKLHLPTLVHNLTLKMFVTSLSVGIKRLLPKPTSKEI